MTKQQLIRSTLRVGKSLNGNGSTTLHAVTLFSAVSLGVGCAAAQISARQPHSVVIRDVTVVDVRQGALLLHRDVITRGARIARIAPTRLAPVPAGATLIDGQGQFLIPGLWDMHTHSGGYTAASRSYPGLLARGIVGVRDMGTPLAEITRIRDSLQAGAFEGPHLIFCGPLIQGPLPFTNRLIAQVHDGAEVAAAVDSLSDAGVDCLKVHDGISLQLWSDVLREGRGRGIPVVGHIAPDVPALTASQAGQRSIEHLGGRFLGVLLGMASNEDSLRPVELAVVHSIVSAIEAGRTPDDMDIYRAPFAAALLEGQSALKRRELLKAFATNRTWQTPTLVALPLRTLLARTDTLLAAEDRRADEGLLALCEQTVAAFNAAGVPMLAGTDLDLSRPRLVDELALMVEAGLSPAAALQTATVNPARFLGWQRTGAVSEGYEADLVLLPNNPLTNIRNLDNVALVVFQGRIVRSEMLRPELPNER